MTDWNFGDLLDATAVAVPGDRPALIRGGHVTNWAELDARTNRLARAMLPATCRLTSFDPKIWPRIPLPWSTGVACWPSTASSSPPPPMPPIIPISPPSPSGCACALFLKPPRIAGSSAAAPAWAVPVSTPSSREIESSAPVCFRISAMFIWNPLIAH